MSECRAACLHERYAEREAARRRQCEQCRRRATLLFPLRFALFFVALCFAAALKAKGDCGVIKVIKVISYIYCRGGSGHVRLLALLHQIAVIYLNINYLYILIFLFLSFSFIPRACAHTHSHSNSCNLSLISPFHQVAIFL